MTEVEPNREADIITRRCLNAASGEPGYAVQLIYGYVANDHERRRTVNRLWKLMLAERDASELTRTGDQRACRSKP